ncbi:MAG TPA: hypothetical protein VJ742_11765, partial [Nitrososphaera sp.]|nr:hypothetical protein [Nitrososphaera sp.]
RFLIKKLIDDYMLKCLQRFLVSRSLTAAGNLVVVVVIVMILLYQGLCANVENIIVEVRQQIEQEIIDKKLTFDSPEERLEYVNQRIQQGLANRGVDICF